MSISFPYDAVRASHATRWLLHRHGGTLPRLKLIKLVFLADHMHLARYGRPIVGGRYCAMKHGPVASEYLDEVKGGLLDGVVPSGDHDHEAHAEADEDFLSETDLEVLFEIDRAFGSWDQYRLRDYTHSFQAWKKNYREEENGKRSFPLPYEDFFEDVSRDERGALKLIANSQEAEKALG